MSRFSGGSTVPTQTPTNMPTQIRQMPTDLYATSCNFVGFSEAIGGQIWDFRLHLGHKMSASTYKNVAKMQAPVTLTFLAKVGFK